MSGTDSLFSCIQPAGEPRGDARAPKPAPPPPPPPAPAAAQTRNSELEARLNKSEERRLAAENRLAELEKSVAALKTELARTRESLAAGPGPAALAELKQELAALARRLSAAETVASRDAGREGHGGAMAAAERRLKETEARLGEEIERRFAGLDTAIFEIARKALTAKEAAAGNTRRLERLEERTARLTYIEKRLNSSENKFERICECEALAESLKVSVEEVERTLAEMLHKEASLSAENRKTASELQSLSAQVGQISALFNHFRSELSFLVPGKKDMAGG